MQEAKDIKEIQRRFSPPMVEGDLTFGSVSDAIGGITLKKKTPNLMIICDNGHEQDQDVQAATNLRNELADDFAVSTNRIVIPDKMKKIIIRIEN